jgi:hypothetical protein
MSEDAPPPPRPGIEAVTRIDRGAPAMGKGRSPLRVHCAGAVKMPLFLDISERECNRFQSRHGVFDTMPTLGPTLPASSLAATPSQEAPT